MINKRKDKKLFILWVKGRRRNKEEWWKDKKEKIKSCLFYG